MENKKIILDQEEQAILDSFEAGEWGSVKDLENQKMIALEAAKNFFKKDAELIKANIPENEHWLYKDGNLKNLDEAIEWSESHPRRDNFDEIAERIEKTELKDLVGRSPLESAYLEMKKDQNRESEADNWSEKLIGNSAPVLKK